MKGLLLQELYSMKQVGKIYGGAFLIYFVMGLINRNVSNFASVLILLSSMIVVNMFGYHEKSRWEMYAATMPVSRKQMVGSFYAVGMFAMICAFLIGLVLNFTDLLIFKENPAELLFVTIGFWELGILYCSLFIPILIKFGPDKGRMVLVGIYLIPFLLVYLIYNAVGIGEEILNLLFSKGFLGIAAIALAVVVLVSYRISNMLYSQKEF